MFTYNLNISEQLNNHFVYYKQYYFQLISKASIYLRKFQDIDWTLKAVDVPNNGFTFCAGSLSAGLHNDVPKMAVKFANRAHFVHLRSTEVAENGDFMEASHLEGRGHLVELIKIFEKQNPRLPMRVDHGKLMLDNEKKNYNPGYSFMGRMYALEQVSGMMAAVKSMKDSK